MFIEASRRFTKRLGYHMWDFVIFFGVHSIPGGGGGGTAIYGLYRYVPL